MATQPGTRKYAANPADLPRGTLVQLFFNAVDRYQRADAVRYRAAEEWRSISHGVLEERVRFLALGLEALGLQRTDRVAILSENRPEWALADFAALCSGVVGVPIYATLPPNQIAYILNDSGARLVLVSTAEQLAKVREVWGELPALEKVIVFDDVPAEGGKVWTLGQLLDLGRREDAAGKGSGFRERALVAKPEDVATVLYTSGTTGQPKGVMLTHNNIFSNTRAVEHVLPVGPEDVTLSFLPLSHILQRMVDLFLFSKGVTIAYVPAMDMVAQALVEVKPSIVVAVPRVYEKFYNRIVSATGLKRSLVLWAREVGRRWADARLSGRTPPLRVRAQHAVADRLVYRKVRGRLGGRLRFFVSGSAPLDAQIARFFYSAGVMILEGYGLTETSPVTNVNTPLEFRFGTVGKPVPGTEIMTAEDGEILVRGPQVMKGYFNLPEATREALDEEGWFHTGDIGEIDADGYLRITDRKKDLIVTAGGKNIAPQPIENRAKTSRYVAEAVMIGDRRPYPVLLVVPNFESLATWARLHGLEAAEPAALLREPQVRRKVEEDVYRRLEGFARYELPKKIALLDREFSIETGELTPTLKVRRRVVEAHFNELVESLYREREPVPAE